MSLVSIFMTNRAHGWRNDRTGNDSNCFVQRISGDFDFAEYLVWLFGDER